ncbi:MAG: sulfur carrier protein ThiS [Candidatus Aegiribacteria sp.]
MIRVNGDPMEWSPEMTVADVIREKNYLFPLLVVRIDGELVPRDRYGSATVPDGAVVDVIHLMSGG